MKRKKTTLTMLFMVMKAVLTLVRSLRPHQPVLVEQQPGYHRHSGRCRAIWSGIRAPRASMKRTARP